MANRDNRDDFSFDRSTTKGRRAEMAYLDRLSEEEREAYDPGHRYVTANPATTPEREARLAEQLADIEAIATDV